MKNSSGFIQFAIEQGALQFGKFSLKSGRISPYFFNTGQFNNGHSLGVLSKFYAQAIIDSKIQFDMLFGPAYKGIPLVTAVAIALANEHDLNTPYAFNRKHAKTYGDGGQAVGAPIQGKVLIIDDVITAGTAINEAVTIIRGAGGSPTGAAIAFDRQERASGARVSAVEKVAQQFGIEIIAVANAGELIHYAQSEQLYEDQIPKLKKYLEKYRS